jgi:DnaJ-domain-containing protein 1
VIDDYSREEMIYKLIEIDIRKEMGDFENDQDDDWFDDNEDEEYDSSENEEPNIETKHAKILGLKGKVKWDDIKNNYRKLMKEYHPDKVEKLGKKLKEVAEKETREIREAYDYFKEKYGK